MTSYSNLIFVLIIFITSCGPSYFVRKAEKNLKKAGQLGAEWKSDTIIQTIEVPVIQTRVDSTIVIKPGDTVTIFKDRLQVKIKRLKGDTVFIEGECLPDTILVRVPTVVNNTLNCPPAKYKIWDILKGVLLGLIAGFIIGRIWPTMARLL